ncbi:ADP-ribosylglycohydrolase family protein [Micromonospora sp. CPCC 206060]|uniref:ADP-ribosylglycohydrolase family protein n=1 Tax=Micromonospora sp. CPCC 206060 TaxID=3122406 RepID=UPI002FF2BE6C
MSRSTVRQLGAVRGCLLGLMLGDAVGATAGAVPPSGTLPATSAGQLACFTVDGIIRASVRGTLRGICHPPSVVRHAYTRWAVMQGIPGVQRWQDEDWPDGWLAQVPVLAVRRGSAPATVAALQRLGMGAPDNPAGTSTGAHGLTRSLPAGLVESWSAGVGDLAAQIAATTHATEAVHAAALGATIIAHLLRGAGIDAAVTHAQQQCASHLPGAAALPLAPAHSDPLGAAALPLASALAAARSAPAQRDELARLAPDARALSALAGAIYVVSSFPEPARIREALLFAASAGDGGHVATAAGAFLGAAYGVDALPVDWLSRLELVWVADTLARDLVSEFVDHPAGSGYGTAPDPQWIIRYPGW